MAKNITDFMRKRGTFFGVSGLLLGGLEKMMDGNFVCPCKSGENELQTAYYAFIPFFGCFILTFFCVKMPDETKIKNKCTCKRFLFSTIIAFIWLVFFFIDGRYVICALAGWDKGLTCQSTGEIEFKKADPTTKTYLIISKCIGGAILVFVLILYTCLQTQKRRSRRT